MTQIGTEKRESVYTLERKEKCEYGTVFYPFRSKKGPQAPIVLFWKERVKMEWAKYHLHVKINPSRSTFYPSRSIFFDRAKGAWSDCVKNYKNAYLSLPWAFVNLLPWQA